MTCEKVNELRNISYSFGDNFYYQNLFNSNKENFACEILIDFKSYKREYCDFYEVIRSGKVIYSIFDILKSSLEKFPKKIFINVERHNLCDFNIRNCLFDMHKFLENNGHILVVEITERNECMGCGAVEAEMRKMTEWGIIFAIDDVVGIDDPRLITKEVDCYTYAKVEAPSLSSRMSLDKFIKQVEICKQKGLEIIVEKVETYQQLNLLKSLNLTYFQGYYFHRGSIIPS
ncbi:EAL domain-containing protein [Vibrio sp. NTOU-M3]|uniref:EAL domain-containing protein n=1 Tax=Vibrio sp. NTOU-M3 TaxID=3234954 RepID=UPI00349F6912